MIDFGAAAEGAILFVAAGATEMAGGVGHRAAIFACVRHGRLLSSIPPDVKTETCRPGGCTSINLAKRLKGIIISS
jgi:hypothetical protein